MISKKAGRAQLRKGRRAEKKAEHGDLASTTGAAAPKRKTMAAGVKNFKSRKVPSSQVWHRSAVLGKGRSQ
jgi:hypothetical protein